MVPSKLDTNQRPEVALIPVSGIHVRHYFTSGLSLCGGYPWLSLLLACLCVFLYVSGSCWLGETNIKCEVSVHSQVTVEMHVKNFAM